MGASTSVHAIATNRPATAPLARQRKARRADKIRPDRAYDSTAFM
jgi:hypothetical protein